MFCLSQIKKLLAIICFFISYHVSAAESINREKSLLGENILPVFMGLIGMLILIFFLAMLVKRFSSFRMVSNHIKIIESQNIGTKEKLIIVDVQQKQYLLGVTSQNISHICDLESPIIKQASQVSFHGMIEKLMKSDGSKNNSNSRLKKSTLDGAN